MTSAHVYTGPYCWTQNLNAYVYLLQGLLGTDCTISNSCLSAASVYTRDSLRTTTAMAAVCRHLLTSTGALSHPSSCPDASAVAPQKCVPIPSTPARPMTSSPSHKLPVTAPSPALQHVLCTLTRRLCPAHAHLPWKVAPPMSALASTSTQTSHASLASLTVVFAA